MAESASERERRERAAIDAHMRAHKEQAERTGKQVTHEQIQKHVTSIAEDVSKKKGHKIYQGE